MVHEATPYTRCLGFGHIAHMEREYLTRADSSLILQVQAGKTIEENNVFRPAQSPASEETTDLLETF